MTCRALTNGLVRSVAIVGGTHGNEISGIYLVRHLQHILAQMPTFNFETTLLLANKRAIKANTRYVDKDLNRCFLLEDLEKEHSVECPALSWEELRAHQLNSILGPKGSANPKVDFIIDLHNTTSNTGVALMMDARDDFSHEVAAHMQTQDSDVRVCNWATDQDDHPLLPTVSRSGLTFEVGPVSWGVLDSRQLQRSEHLLLETLQYIHTRNALMMTTPASHRPKRQFLNTQVGAKRAMGYTAQRSMNSLTDKHSGSANLESRWKTEALPVFRRASTITYPQDTATGQTMMIHPRLQGRDFTPMSIGDPVFVDMTGDSVIPFSPSHPFWETQEDFPGFEEPLYPFFINEAAYYEKDIAFAFATKAERPVQVMKPDAKPVAKNFL